MKIAVTGATGMVGGALQKSLEAQQHQVHRVVRSKSSSSTDIRWSPADGEIDAAGLAGLDAVVHLAGENIGQGRWTAAKKQRIRDSRIDGTTLLCNTLAELDARPRVLIAASAIGFYGDRGETICDESTAPCDSFLCRVCVDWEEATRPAQEAGVRVVNLRIGVVLSTQGGALEKMLLPFKLGAGGRIGSGRQYWSCIDLEELVAVIEHCLNNDSLSGPVNAVSPHAVTNLEFTKTLGAALGRPTVFPMPAFAARLALGEMADELLLASTRVVPSRLEASGYQFKHPTLRQSLAAALGR